MCHCSTSTFKKSYGCTSFSWTYPPRVKENDRADRLAGKATITGVLRLRRSAVLRSFRHYLRAQSQGHHTIDCLLLRREA